MRRVALPCLLAVAFATANPAPAQVSRGAPLGAAAEDDTLAQTARARRALESGNTAAAEAEMLALVAGLSTRFGPTAPETLMTIPLLAGRLEQAGGSGLALRRLAYERSAMAFGARDPATLGALGWLALCLVAESDPGAVAMSRRAVAENQAVFGPDAPETRGAEITLAAALREAGELDAALALLGGLQARFERAAGDDRLGLALVLTELGQVQAELGADKVALATLDRAAALTAELVGPDTAMLGGIDHARAAILLRLDRIEEAEAVARMALDRATRTGETDPAAHQALRFDLAQALATQGRLDEARTVAEEATLAALTARSTDAAGRIEILARFSEFLGNLGRPEFQIGALRAMLALAIAQSGPNAPTTYALMSDLGDALVLNGELDEGRALMKAGLAGLVATVRPGDPALLRARHLMAILWLNDGRVAEALEAEETYFRSIRAARGPDAADTLRAQLDLAGLMQFADRPTEADALLADALARIADTPETRGLSHQINWTRAEGLLARDMPKEALALLRSEWDYAVAEFSQESADIFLPGARQSHRNGIAHKGLLLAQAAWLTAAEVGGVDAASLRDAAFEHAQLAAPDETSDAVSRAMARAMARDPGLGADFAELERLRDQGVRDRVERFGRLARGEGLAAGANADASGAFAALHAKLARDHPEVLAAMNPAPTPVDRLRGTDGREAILGPDEVLVLIAGTRSTVRNPAMRFSLVWAVSREGVAWAAIPLTGYQLADAIARLRDDLDPRGASAPALEVVSRAPVRPGGAGPVTAARAAPRPFDTAASQALYQAIFGAPAIAGVMADKPKVIVIAQGEALELPFNALVTRPPPAGTEGAKRLRATGWLGLDRALVTLPSVTAFAALRERAAKGARGRLGYVAFGAPEFGAGSPLPPLPETGREVTRIAALTGLDPLALELGTEANEARLGALAADGRLGAADILHFATHGVIVRDAGGGAPEPALALTPPADDKLTPGVGLAADGFLTANEVAGLRLSADWVLLSACDTAARIGGGVRGLKGLAEGFFLAGARNVLVSQWRVQDDIAARLMIDAVGGTLDGLPKAEALRRAMRDVAMDPSGDGGPLPDSHPAVWAPFILMGGGG